MTAVRSRSPKVTSTGVPSPAGWSQLHVAPSPSSVHPINLIGKSRSDAPLPVARHQSGSTHGPPIGADVPRTSPSAPRTASSRHFIERPGTSSTINVPTLTRNLRSSAAGALETLMSGAPVSHPFSRGSWQRAGSGSGSMPGPRTEAAAVMTAPCGPSPSTRAIRSTAVVTAGGASIRPISQLSRRPSSWTLAPPRHAVSSNAASC